MVGKESFLLDKAEPVCPYLSACSGRKCPFYKLIEKKNK